MPLNEIKTFYPASQKDWRQWLKKNHGSERSVWLVQHKKGSGKESITWSQAVDEALCFGWIDSTRKTLDKDTFIQFFTKRKANSVWSKINKQKVLKLIEDGLMTKAGFDSIETAKQNGSWTILDSVEELTVPKDLAAAFKNNPGAKPYFTGLSKSARKAILQWIVLAKRADTRAKRINEIAELAAKKQKPKQFL